MLKTLHKVLENELVGLMKRPAEWSSVHVTYHAPRVERLWIQVGPIRVFLHRIYPCDEGEALFHPHPWPSAVHIMNGQYEHKVGYRERVSNTETVTHELSTGILTAGSEYEMVTPKVWHSVRPLGEPSDSIMVAGSLFQPAVKMPSPPTEKQQPLSTERFNELFDEWHELIDHPVDCDTCGWEGRYHDLECFRDDEGKPIESEYTRCPQCEDEDQIGSRRKVRNPATGFEEITI